MNTTHETWRPVEGYDGDYEVSDQGRVRSLKRGGSRILKSCQDHDGYPQVTLSARGVQTTKSIHRLVADAFLGERPAGLSTCHADGDTTHNAVSNLRYDTPSANTLDSVRHGRHAFATKTHCKHGHEFTEANTYREPARPNKRCCRACDKHRTATRAAKRRANASR